MGEFETAAEMSAGLRSGRVGSRELVERALSRIEAWQPSTNAFIQVWADEALAQADRVDAARAAGEDPGPWAGVPIAVKDMYDVEGRETNGCSRAYAGRVPGADAPIITRLRSAGLVMVGKTNQHELTAGGTNLYSAYGRTANPWDPDRITGGSSGGSAAAVAAGVVPWALGSDTGGSIRIPSGLCGTVGFKPTYGSLPLQGLMPLAPSMDTPGPIASTVEDAAVLFDLMAGGEGTELGDGAGAGAGEPTTAGLPDGYFAGPARPETLAAVRTVADTLAGDGVEVRPMDGSGIDDLRAVWDATCFSEFAAAHPALKDPERRALLSPQVRSWIEEGETVSPEDAARFAARREEIRQWFLDHLATVDVLVIPTSPYPAMVAGQEEVDLGPFGVVKTDTVGPGWLTCSVNLTGLPAITLPAASSPEGLPIGVSLVGGHGRERSVLDAAARWARVAGYRPARPSAPVASA